jgi:3-dehydroquinate dehydratase
MALVRYQKDGGNWLIAEAETLGELRRCKNLDGYTAVDVSGDTLADTDELEANQAISFNKATKGGA